MDNDLLFGLAVLMVGIICILKGIIDRKRATRLSATITGVIQRDGYFFLLVTFQYEGEEHSAYTGNGSRHLKENIGDQVEIYFRPNKRKYVNMVGNNTDIIFSLAFIVLGALWILVGALR